MSDIYKIGVAIMLTDGLSPALSLISHRLLGVHKSVNQINSGLGNWKTALIGAAGVMVGAGLIRGFVKIAEHGKELLDQQDKLIRAGRTHAEVAQLTADAYERITKAVPTATGADVLRVANELTLVKGDFKDAIAATAGALKLEAILGNATGRRSEGEGYNVWRALELKNVTMNRELTDRLMGGIVQSMIVSGGKISGLDWMTAARQGGVAWTNADPAFVMGAMPTIIQELGGMRTGTSMMTAYQTLLGATTLRKQQLDMFEKLGMIDMDKVHHDAGGRVNIAPGAIKGSGIGMTDPFRWTQEVLKPALVAAGYETIDKQREVMAKIFPNRNANRMFDIFLDPASVARIIKDRELYSHGRGLNPAFDDFVRNNPKGVEAAFHAQWESMLGAIGAPLMQSAMPVMIAITKMFNHIGAFAQQHPKAIELIGIGVAALGAALITTGGIALLAAIGPAGWLIAGLIGLAAAIGMFADHREFLEFFGALPDRTPEQLDRKKAAHERLLRHGNPWDQLPPKPDKQSSIGDVYLDGRKVGAILFDQAARSASGPNVSSAYFDPSMAHTPVDYNFARA